MLRNLCKINARKLDGKVYKSWQAELIEHTPDYWLFLGIFDKEAVHNELGVIRRNTISYEYYWKNHWFNVFRFHEPEGEFRNFYCNINQPPLFSENTLDYVDLDIDLIVKSDYSYQIVDMEEFESNSQRFNYSPFIKQNVDNSISQLIELLKNRQFPFNYLNEIN